jgi:lipopolysaccharide/colanic/teichoic acid biosynthesis glycosyltransferase
MIKRGFDLIVSGVALLILSPVLAIIAVVVKADSPGPALFRQRRVGRFGRPFTMHKFRTMREGERAPGYALTVGADPRITTVGAFLRRYKLDELPQLFDVFVGNMSLVGPRPEMSEYVERYPDEVRKKILSVRPGITDPASIEFRNESALLATAPDPERMYVEEILPRKLASSTSYLSRRSLLSDIRLIFQTLRASAGSG